jgi:nondiscriminating glutamyl-tRNA synthetase
MKWIKKRNEFLTENQIKDNTLDILASRDDNQNSVLQDTLDKLDHAPVSGKVVTRFAPSPTGLLHIGGIRTALYNYLFAKQHDGIFYLRIEDTDQKRFVSEAEDYIKNALDWVGIHPDYAPWKPGSGEYAKMRQSERDYSKHISKLLNDGNAYYAFDTEEDLNNARQSMPNFAYDQKTRMKMKNSLSLSKEKVDKLLNDKVPYVIRFKVPENKTVSFTDMVRGNVSVNSAQVDDKVLVKSNGIPTYHMASVCDDHDMGTTHVIRGEEWLPSAPLHLMLYEAFGWDAPQFAHLPSILRPDGKGKLSKRDGLKYGIPVFPFGGEGVDDKGNVVKYKGFKDEGFEPDAVVNFLLLLGWAPSDGTELYKIADMISQFSIDRVHKAGARFDMDKAKWFNSVYVQSKSDEELLQHIDMGDTYTYNADKLSMIVDLCKKRSTFKGDMQVVADIFFKPVVLTDKDKSSLSDDYKKVFTEFLTKVDTINWDVEKVKQLIYDICQEHKIKMGKVMPSLRLSVTGGVPGPDLMTTMFILGKDESISRIKNSL